MKFLYENRGKFTKKSNPNNFVIKRIMFFLQPADIARSRRTKIRFNEK
jgi:hypothetical protein